MEIQEIDGIKVQIGDSEIRFGAVVNADEINMEMNNPKENGVVRNANGDVIATFANAAQAVGSFVLAGWNGSKIKKLFPALKINNSTVVKMVADMCSKSIRRKFIESLDGNKPRHLTIDEVVAITDVIGSANNVIKGLTVQEVYNNIILDMDNIDRLMPNKTTRSIDPVKIQNKIAVVEKALARNTKKVTGYQDAIRSYEEDLQENPEDEGSKYGLAKAQTHLKIAISDKAELEEKLEKLRQSLSAIETPA